MGYQSSRRVLVRRICSRHSGELRRLRKRAALCRLATEISQSTNYSLGIYLGADAQSSATRAWRRFDPAPDRETKGHVNP